VGVNKYVKTGPKNQAYLQSCTKFSNAFSMLEEEKPEGFGMVLKHVQNPIHKWKSFLFVTH
jgi:hypothetical protein